MLLGEIIREAVKADPRKYREIYEACHVPQRTFIRFMNDDRMQGNVRLETVQRIADEVGITFRPLNECDQCIWEHNKIEIRKVIR